MLTPVIPPATWPPLTYLHPATGAYTSSTQSAPDVHGNVWYAIVANPPGAIDSQYLVLVKVTPDNRVYEAKRLYARDSRAWLLSHGCHAELVNGKYGNVSISVAGSDVVLGIEVRIEGLNTTMLWRERGLAV